jgi:hypothetical protein
VNPVLRQLRQAKDANEIADLLEKHIGNSSNCQHCKEAYEALVDRVRLEDARSFAVFIHVMVGDNDWCAHMHTIIRAFRAGQVGNIGDGEPC